MKYKRRNSFSATNASQNEAKLAYIRLNSQMPCPPRGTVPVNQRRRLEVLSLATSESLSVMAATISAMSPFFYLFDLTAIKVLFVTYFFLIVRTAGLASHGFWRFDRIGIHLRQGYGGTSRILQPNSHALVVRL